MMLKIKVVAYRIPVLILTLAMVLMVLTSCGGPSQGPVVNIVNNPPIQSDVSNTVPVTAGVTSSGGPNGLFTSVTVCGPAVIPVGQNPVSGPPLPPTCQTIPNILVDTNSVGLRLVESSTVDNLGLPWVTFSNGDIAQECVQFADFSYAWGPVARATIQMAGETAAQVPLLNEMANTGIPVQIITSPNYLTTAVPSSCLASPLSGGVPIALNTPQTLGANGILGIGSFMQDCGAACASTPPRNQYYTCPSNLCSVATVPQNLQVWNPVAAFAYDNNGLTLTLPNVGFGGSGPISGSLIFGIGTQSDNTLRDVQLYPIDAYGNFPQVSLTVIPTDPTQLPYPLVSYLSPQNGSYIDSSSPAIYFSDAQSLGIPECLDTNGQPLGLYCPTVVSQFTANVYGTNSTVGLLSWNVENATTLLNSGNSVFSTLGGDSGISVATDYVDVGLPFFLGRTVYVGFAGTSMAYPQVNTPPITYPNGYWAF
jgi:hypothetical protein